MKITEEMVQALATLRLHRENDVALAKAIDVLDNAGIFAPIDEHTDYDTNPDPAPTIPWNALIYWHLSGERESNRARAYLVHARTEDGAIGAAEAVFHQDEGEPAGLRERRPIIDGIKVSEARKDPAEWGDTTGYDVAPTADAPEGDR